MKRILAGALCALSFTGVSGTASAVPISFGFSATITGTSGHFAHTGLEGLSFWGGFLFETDNLVRMESPDLSMVQYYDSNASWHNGITYAWVTYGTRYNPFPENSGANTSNIYFRDNCNPVYCTEPYYSDSYGLWADYVDLPLETIFSGNFVGSYQVTSLNVEMRSFVDLFEWSSRVPMDALTMPMPNAMGSYGETTVNCPGGNFSCIAERSDIGFTIDWMTRGVVEPQPVGVPEPGSLGLSAVGLLAALLTRRRIVGKRA